MADAPNDAPRPRLSVRPHVTAFETVLLVGGLTLFLLLLFEMHMPPRDGRFLNPPLVALAGVVLLWPLRQQPTVRAMLFSGGLLLLLWFMNRLSAVLLPFAFVYLLAYLFDPAVSRLRERYGISRALSSFAAMALVVGVLVLFVLILVPNILGQLETLATRILGSVGNLRTWLLTTPLLDELAQTGLVDKNELIQQITDLIQQQAGALAASIPNAAQGVVRSIGSLFGLITTVTILPVIFYYLLKDYPFIKPRLVELFPTFGGQRDYLVKAGGIVGNYLRGQLLICLIAATIISTALLIFDVPFALLIGLMAGVLNLIPSLGIIITYVIGGLLMVLFGDPWYVDTIIVVGVILGESVLEQSVLTPKIMSQQVGLHPVLILLSLFVFGAFMGLFGLIIAVPATALIMTVYKAYRDDLTLDLAAYGSRWRQRRRRRVVTPPPAPMPATAPAAAAPAAAAPAAAAPASDAAPPETKGESPASTQPDADRSA